MKDSWPIFACEIGEIAPFDPDVSSCGKKANGIAKIPQKWTLPFFVIGPAFLHSHNSDSSSDDFNRWLDFLQETLVASCVGGTERIIIRSSGEKEGIGERGRYTSVICSNVDFRENLLNIAEKLREDRQLDGEKISLLVQSYAEPRAKGHLSNERRCHKEKRDWLGEIEEGDGSRGGPFDIHHRNWRHMTTYPENVSLGCTLRTELTDALRAPAKWGASRETRLHFEWVWDGSNVWVVQADEALDEKGFDPIGFKKAVRDLEPVEKLSLLRRVSEVSDLKFAKGKNVRLYQNLGLPTTSLYVLDDQSQIEILRNGRVETDLKRDLEILVNLPFPLIIRTDIDKGNHGQRQLLPRTDGCNDVREAEKWLIATTTEVSEENPDAKIAYFFHSFIPSSSSGFAFARPGHRYVEIETLWGLPEGLYYNSHDKWSVDTKSSENLASSSTGFDVSVKTNFKQFCVAPADDDSWTTQTLGSPFDWKPSVEHQEWMQEVALGSRKIAEEVGEAVSVMWFLGVPEKFFGTPILPWFHESIDNRLLGHDLRTRRKTVFDKTHQIKSASDLLSLKSGELKHVKRIQLSPVEDQLIRNKNLLRDVGEIAKERGVTVVLNGGMLSHAYYQLKATGAIVEVVHPFEQFRDEQGFNKLVRDRIPEIIELNGEKSEAHLLEASAKLSALKDKLIEEAYEVHDTEEKADLIEELADVLEVVHAICSSNQIGLEEVEEKRREKERKKGGFESGIVLKKTQAPSPSTDHSELLLFELESELPTLNDLEYQRLAKISQARPDKVTINSLEALRFTLHIPVIRDSWKGKLGKLRVPDSRFTAGGEMAIRREGSKLFLELNFSLSESAKDLFGEDLD